MVAGGATVAQLACPRLVAGTNGAILHGNSFHGRHPVYENGRLMQSINNLNSEFLLTWRCLAVIKIIPVS